MQDSTDTELTGPARLRRSMLVEGAREPVRSVRRSVTPTGRERTWPEDDVIVSKTDLQGRITYANRCFWAVSDYREEELIGQPHSLIRHPEMPRTVFKVLWDTIASGREIFAYVVNLTRGGDHYWVLAHVTPTFDDGGRITGYHSNRRVPERRALDLVRPLYARVLAEENRHVDRVAGLSAGVALVGSLLAEKKVSWDEFVFSL